MSVLPRWLDDFSTDPTSDPAYTIVSGIAYDGAGDKLVWLNETTSPGITLLNSDNDFGIMEVDLDLHNQGFVPSSSKIFIRCFGYYIVFGQVHTVFITDDNTEWYSAFDQPGYNPAIENAIGVQAVLETNYEGFYTHKFISTPNGLDYYVDDAFKVRVPFSSASVDVKISAQSNNENVSFELSRLSIKADASLPKAGTIIEPTGVGALAAADGPIVISIPESRLYLDLGTYAGQITGLTSVVYDPLGTPVAMTQDTGIPDGSGGTTGDFYLEIPSEGVASDYRLVLKEAFVTANSVVVTDDIDFDVTGGPAAQNALIKEEDDLHCVVQKSDNYSFIEEYNVTDLVDSAVWIAAGLKNRPLNNYNAPNASKFTIHNSGADGNPYTGRLPTGLFNDNYSNIVNMQVVSPNLSFPILLDIDLGKVRTITNIMLASYPYTNQVMSADLYSKTTPFSGAGVQGVLEVDSHPIYIGSPVTAILPLMIKAAQSVFSITTRYLRLQVNSDDVFGSLTGTHIGRQLYLFGTHQNQIDSSNDNAQFEHEPAVGGGYVAYPAGGITQGDGKVRITLPTLMEVSPGVLGDFFNFKFKPDLTD